MRNIVLHSTWCQLAAVAYLSPSSKCLPELASFEISSLGFLSRKSRLTFIQAKKVMSSEITDVMHVVSLDRSLEFEHIPIRYSAGNVYISL